MEGNSMPNVDVEKKKTTEPSQAWWSHLKSLDQNHMVNHTFLGW